VQPFIAVPDLGFVVGVGIGVGVGIVQPLKVAKVLLNFAGGQGG
jgi:hypothetical protein